MTPVHGNPGEIHELARYEVRPESLDICLAAIHEFVAYVRKHEAGALRYEVWQEAELTFVPDAGHTAVEPGIARALVAATQKFRNG